MSFRKQQVESLLKRTISELLVRKVSDPRIEGMVSVTSVDVSPDLSQATVRVSILPSKHEKTTVAGLNHAASYIHGLVRKAVSLRTVPHLTFRLDSELKRQAAVIEAINRGVAREADSTGQATEASPESSKESSSGSAPEQPGEESNK
jgi:ribosome-binding factor A